MRISCPVCSKEYTVPDQAIGRDTKCKNCGERFKIEATSRRTAPSLPRPLTGPPCDNPVPPWAVSTPLMGTAESPQQTPPPPHSRSGQPKNGRFLPLALVAILLVAGGAAAWFLVSASKSGPPKKTAEPIAASGTPTNGAAQPPDQRPEPPPVRANISGGAWLTRKSATSEIIRGLDVYVLRAQVEKKVLSKPLASIEKRALYYSDLWRKDEGRQIYGHATEVQLAEVIRNANSVANAARGFQQLSHDTPVELKQVYALVTAIDSFRERSERWIVGSPELERLVRVKDAIGTDLMPTVMESGALVAQAKTGIDGKYTVSSLPESDYCLYALYKTDLFLVEWLVKTSARGAGGPEQDLSNDNASIIINIPR